MKDIEDLSELPRHNLIQIAQVLTKFKIDPFVGNAKVKDAICNPTMNLD